MQLSKAFFQSVHPVSYLGTGAIGGKARGLEFIHSALVSRLDRSLFPDFAVDIPKMIVIRTDVFDDFMQSNDLWPLALSDEPDEKIALEFQQAGLPFHILGDLRMIVTEIKLPLAIRSSSLLEDAMHEPFAGIYRTKMTPNNQLDVDTRFRKLAEAVKFVYASTFFKAAKGYMRATRRRAEDEKMAVIIQEMAGNKYGERFYPEISGVLRSYNFYPAPGAAPEEGVVNLALGLGKTIVDEGGGWAYSPALPASPPPFPSMKEMLEQTQLKFWAVNMGPPPEYDPIRETEYLSAYHFTEAQKDGTLPHLVSSYDPESGRLWPGLQEGCPLILTFAPILSQPGLPLNELLKSLMPICENTLKTAVEVEFAVALSKDTDEAPHRFAFLQVRPLAVSSGKINVSEEDLLSPQAAIASGRVMGNGQVDNISDIVFVKLQKADPGQAFQVAGQLEKINRALVAAQRPYLLIGYGRWGTTDPWAGIPVDWSQISGARVIVEAAGEHQRQDMSQGSHFFHNMTSFRVFYFSIPYPPRYAFDLEWISQLETVEETPFVKHVVTAAPLKIKADGKTGRGVIMKCV